MHFRSTSEDETKQWAADLVRSHFDVLKDKPVVITLEGAMGAGKTQLAKGIAEGLGITKIIPSPTYVLTREYQGPEARLIHIDCWRTPEITPQELNFASYLVPQTVIVIEWPKPLLGHLEGLGEAIKLVSLKMHISGEVRDIEVTEK